MAIITKQKDAFKSVGHSHSQKQVSNQVVGNTYGARQAIKKAAIPPDKVVAKPAKPLDNFSKKTNSSSLAQFSPKASFKRTMGRRFSGTPHKPAVLDHIENGSMAFDYHLLPGIVKKSNALELMRSIGLEV